MANVGETWHSSGLTHPHISEERYSTRPPLSISSSSLKLRRVNTYLPMLGVLFIASSDITLVPSDRSTPLAIMLPRTNPNRRSSGLAVKFLAVVAIMPHIDLQCIIFWWIGARNVAESRASTLSCSC